MPKVIELTVQLNVRSVSCPGVWLCQDGRVSLTVFTLGTSYQTCLLPPVFPLMFKDVFYFRKRFQEVCTFNNICCLLKNETIYCELVQWSEGCGNNQCMILAQYLGSLNQILFPPNTCSTDGVDLLMRRSKEFPGILSPKIEVSTKVRIDEVWCRPPNASVKPLKPPYRCSCPIMDEPRQRPVCHSARYHRRKCVNVQGNDCAPRSRSRSSEGARSCCSLKETKPHNCFHKESRPYVDCRRNEPYAQQYNVYNIETADMQQGWRNATHNHDPNCHSEDGDPDRERCSETNHDLQSRSKVVLNSMFIDNEIEQQCEQKRTKHNTTKINPCVCEICQRYHELFHV